MVLRGTLAWLYERQMFTAVFWNLSCSLMHKSLWRSAMHLKRRGFPPALYLPHPPPLPPTFSTAAQLAVHTPIHLPFLLMCVCVHGQFSHLGALWLNVVWQVETFDTINYCVFCIKRIYKCVTPPLPRRSNSPAFHLQILLGLKQTRHTASCRSIGTLGNDG